MLIGKKYIDSLNLSLFCLWQQLASDIPPAFELLAQATHSTFTNYRQKCATPECKKTDNKEAL